MSEPLKMQITPQEAAAIARAGETLPPGVQIQGRDGSAVILLDSAIASETDGTGWGAVLEDLQRIYSQAQLATLPPEG